MRRWFGGVGKKMVGFSQNSGKKGRVGRVGVSEEGNAEEKLRLQSPNFREGG